jgi:pimeloyl-ACP methyl ester carboxylesterase
MPLATEHLLFSSDSQSEGATWTDREVLLPGRGRTWIRESRNHEDAPTLFLLHGLAATGLLNWFTAFPTLAERFNVVMLDHRGHGRGIRTDRFQLSDCADDAIALADELGIESIYPVGYSMGGPIAKLTAHRHPDRVRGLVLCATANRFSRPRVRNVARAVMPGIVAGARLAPGFFQARIVDTMLRNVSRGKRRDALKKELERSNPATVLQAAHETIRFSSYDWAADLSMPTAIVITTKDKNVSPRRQYRLAQTIPNSQVFEVDGDHLACVVKASGFVPTLVEACDHVVQQSKQE